ncbi:DUF4286 family protein [Wandonia haliotis]|uniref:DUF4286 family protein n=1 Tax=Wandonia haliotis TaxID=574963 RepID=A0ABN1MM51_9FLAO
MILYNVTVSIDEAVHDDWLKWMKEVHIPDVMATGLFLESRIARIHAEEEGGLSYAISYLCESKAVLEQYNTLFAPKLQREHALRYNGQFAAFRTILEVVGEFKK